jgi:aldehyde dehydrogenase (NAD+)
VQESIYEPLIAKLKRRLTTLRVGDPLDKNTDVGAINSRQQLEKIEELVAAGKEEGAEIYQPPCRLPEKGYWFVPTVFTNVAQSYRIAQEEIFGPVLSVLTFRTPDEAVEKANNTPYGSRPACGRRRARGSSGWRSACAPASIWANTYNRFDPASPFGGYKESASAREGGRHGLEPYLAFDGAGSAGAERGGRLPVKKTYKLFVGGAVSALGVGAHVRGRRARTSRGPRRKDVPRRGVRIAGGAQPKWAG